MFQQLAIAFLVWFGLVFSVLWVFTTHRSAWQHPGTLSASLVFPSCRSRVLGGFTGPCDISHCASDLFQHNTAPSASLSAEHCLAQILKRSLLWADAPCPPPS